MCDVPVSDGGVPPHGRPVRFVKLPLSVEGNSLATPSSMPDGVDTFVPWETLGVDGPAEIPADR